MPFWKKEAADVRNLLAGARKRVNLPALNQQVFKIIELIDEIGSKFAAAKIAIQAEADLLASRPWIAPRFDAGIRNLANAEFLAVRRMEDNLSTYFSIASTAQSPAEIEDVVVALESEAAAIDKREKENEKLIEGMEQETLRERLRNTVSIDFGSLSTVNEKIPLNNIARAVRQFGGNVELRSGGHQYAIIFPNSTQPIPLSTHAYSRGLANEIRVQLANSLPARKIPSTSALSAALVAGDIHRAA